MSGQEREVVLARTAAEMVNRSPRQSSEVSMDVYLCNLPASYHLEFSFKNKKEKKNPKE